MHIIIMTNILFSFIIIQLWHHVDLMFSALFFNYTGKLFITAELENHEQILLIYRDLFQLVWKRDKVSHLGVP